MSGLRRRVVSAIAVLGVAMSVAAALGTAVVARGFEAAEQRVLEERLATIEVLVDGRGASIAASVRDYAFWNESLSFVRGEYPAYPDDQIGGTETLVSLGIEALVYRDVAGELPFAVHVEDEEETPLPGDIAAWVVDAPTPELGTSSIATTTIDGRPAIVAFAGVTDNDKVVGPEGLIAMAAVVDGEMLAELSAASGTELSLADATVDAGLTIVDRDTAVGRFTLDDLDGMPVATVEVAMERSLASVARSSTAWLFGVLAVGGVLAVAGFATWLSRHVTRRVAALDLEVTRLREGGTGTITVAGDDEIASLADNVQDLLAEVEAHQRRRADEKQRRLTEHSSDIVALCDDAGTVRHVTPALERVLGRDPRTAIGRPLVDVLGAEDPDAGTAMIARLVTVSPEHPLTFLVTGRAASGEVRNLEVVGINHLGTADVESLVLTIRDQTERRQWEEDLRRQAVTDSLTGLPNRTLFLDRLDHSLARAARGDIADPIVLFIDLDDFKTVNDALGHVAGDAVLVEVATRLGEALRPADTVARLGGDEFACLLEGMNEAAAVNAVIDRIQASIGSPIVVGDESVAITASIGVAAVEDSTDAEDMMRSADLAMYVAKTNGKARHEHFTPRMLDQAMRRMRLKSAMAAALEDGQFRLVYQPLVELAGGTPVGAEALLRWQHPTEGNVRPDEFIPLAEETGFIVPLGRWVLLEACREAVVWQQAHGPVIHVSVNVSARQLDDDRIVEDVRTALAVSGLDPGLLQLELTESLFISDRAVVAGILGELKALGVTLAVDDFGTGHASLAYLRDFPLDVLKIDRAFVQAIEEGGEADDFLTGVLSLARSLDLRTLAEGIEQARERDVLVAAECELGQGYLYARPLDDAVFRAWLQEHVAAGRHRPSVPATPRER